MTDLKITHDAPETAAVADEDAVVVAAPTGWVCDSEERAAWAIDKILAARERHDRVSRQAAKLVEITDRELAATEAFFMPLLEEWALQNPPRSGRTVHLGTGSISFRRVSGRVRVVDADAAVAWVRQNLPAALRRKVIESVVVDEVARHVRGLKDDEPLPPGVVVDGDADSFHVSGPKGSR